MNASKPALRRRLLAARRDLDRAVHDREAVALAAHLDGLTTIGSVCAYAPLRSEPGSMELLDRLLDRGVRVLLPVVVDLAQAAALRWGVYHPGTLRPAAHGLLEPPPPLLPEATIGEVDVVLAPALAVDRAGMRLGRGGGFYDRSLVLRDPAAVTIAVIRDCELVEEVPVEPHDVPVTHVLTPALGIVSIADLPLTAARPAECRRPDGGFST